MSRLIAFLRANVHPVVFPVSAGLTVGFVVFAGVFTDTAGRLFTPLQVFITTQFGWFMIAGVASMLAFSLYLAIGPYAKVKLGPDDSEPDYSTLSWFAMLFSAGMGIGLLYYGVAEPLTHYLEPPRGVAPESQAAAQQAMNITFHHYGFSPWAVYAVLGLGLAYFGFRRDLPLTMRSLFQPLLGERIHGGLGHAIDTLAVLGTVFGVATSLGFGVMQINAGMATVFGWDLSTRNQMILIAVITLAATASVAAGLDSGIQRISQVNINLAALLLVFVFLAGPTTLLLSAYVENVGHYVQTLIDTLLWSGTYEGSEWLSDWTLFYWAWWISWSPFVGMFIARISRGRTIREFVLGVLLVPTMVSFLWFTVFGNTAIELERAGAGLGAVVQEDFSSALFALLDQFPLATVTSVVTTLVVGLFFVTSSDSGSFVVDMLTSGGSTNTPVQTRVFWAVSEGAVAAALLLSGGLAALQAAAISTGLPFLLVLLLASWSLLKGLREERPAEPRSGPRLPPASLPDATYREQEFRKRELELRERELQLRERALQLAEQEFELTVTNGGEDAAAPPGGHVTATGQLDGELDAGREQLEAARHELAADARELAADARELGMGDPTATPDERPDHA
ncbi:MAG: BCCT family transporter [Nitriliruptor sp.]|nr:MAG: BCCT family transporter [Nitriliruptor sp.]